MGLKDYGLAALAAAFGLALLALYFVHGRLEATQADLAQARVNERAAIEANKGLEASVKRCNASVADVEAEAKARADRAAAALAEAESRSAVLTGQIASLRKRPLPVRPADDCRQLEADLNEAIENRRKAGK